MKDIDRILKGNRRRLKTHPEKVLMDATGERLFADYLDDMPGFSGRINFIHAINIPALFYLSLSGLTEKTKSKIFWSPGHLNSVYENCLVSVSEERFITYDDIAVDSLRIINKTGEGREVLFKPGSSNGFYKTTFGETLKVNYFLNGHKLKETACFYIKPYEEQLLVFSAAVTLDSEEVREKTLKQRVISCFSDEKALENQINEYQKWFDPVPVFESDDDYLNELWAYRWYVLRHSEMNPACGNLKHLCFTEGKNHKTGKIPYNPSGWEFSKVIPLSVPMNLLDLRWYPDDRIALEMIRTMNENQTEDGEFPCVTVNRRWSQYANFWGYAVYEYYKVSGNPEILKEAAEGIKKQAEGWKNKYGNEEDSLLTQFIHQQTGMEYQPSFWYFSGFPKDCKNPLYITPLKRVDRNVYYYLNVLSLSRIFGILNDKEGESKYACLAEKIRGDILTKMWDGETGFFYDLHYKTGEKAFVKNITGVFPAFAGLVGADKISCIKTLFTEEFDTGCPFPSVSTLCPVYSSEGGWQGNFIKGRNGCVWNGPAWPFANSIVLDGIGAYSYKNGHILDREFAKYLNAFNRLHYHGGDGELPYLAEHYDSRSGEIISDEADYSHSYWIDLIVRYIAGIHIEDNQVVIEPLHAGLDYFRLGGIIIKKHLFTVFYCKDTGLKVFMDGECFEDKEGRGRIEVYL